MNYPESLEWLSQRPKLAFDKGVARVAWLLVQLGNPQLATPTIHVVGTNGKGSTIAFLESIWRRSGYRVGRFTSPSILDDREQLVVDGQMISEEDFAAILTDLRPLAERLAVETDLEEASDFELLVVAFFVYTSQYVQVDILLVEAGMGGLLDATNVLSPMAIICPSIGLDHQAFLGQTHADIARHKAGVMRPDVPFYYASDVVEVQAVFEQEATKCGCPTLALGRDIDRTAYEISLQGDHQRDNASLAVAAARGLQSRFPALTEEVIRAGLTQAVWPGRLEWLSDNLLIDGAHNREGIESLCAYLADLRSDKPIRLLFAAINTKPAPEMLDRLAELAQVSVTTFEDNRALALDDYPAGYERVADYRDWLAGVTGRSLSVVTGSLYFIKQVRAYLLDT